MDSEKKKRQRIFISKNTLEKEERKRMKLENPDIKRRHRKKYLLINKNTNEHIEYCSLEKLAANINVTVPQAYRIYRGTNKFVCILPYEIKKIEKGEFCAEC